MRPKIWQYAVALLMLSQVALGQDGVLPGRVLSVHDGDTIMVQLQSGPISVRLYGIDAPEMNQSHGVDSRTALTRLVGAREVQLEPTGQESYDRMVAIVYVSALNVNKEMVKDGQAWAARKYLHKTEGAAWCASENAARVHNHGLWSQPTSQWIDPGEWRHRQKRHEKYTNYAHETTAHCIAAIGK